MSRAFSLAGFEVTLIGRFWVTTEAARNVPVNVSRSTTTVVLRSPSILFLALSSAMKKTIHKRIVTIMRVIEK